MDSSNRDSLVDLIFGKCALVYGRDFVGRWEGMDLAEVKADWVRELGPLLEHPDAIRYGLENLPEKPPTVLTFRALCIKRQPKSVKELPAPKADPALTRELVAQMRQRQAALNSNTALGLLKDAMRDGEPKTNKELQAMTNLHLNSVQRTVMRLRDKGLVRFHGFAECHSGVRPALWVWANPVREEIKPLARVA